MYYVIKQMHDCYYVRNENDTYSERMGYGNIWDLSDDGNLLPKVSYCGYDSVGIQCIECDKDIEAKSVLLYKTKLGVHMGVLHHVMVLEEIDKIISLGDFCHTVDRTVDLRYDSNTFNISIDRRVKHFSRELVGRCNSINVICQPDIRENVLMSLIYLNRFEGLKLNTDLVKPKKVSLCEQKELIGRGGRWIR